MSTLSTPQDAEGITTSLAPTQMNQAMDTPSAISHSSPRPPMKLTEHSKYSAICTSLGKIYPTELPMSLDWDGDEEEEKGDQEIGENQDKDSEKKTLQTNSIFFVKTTLTL